MAEPPRQVEKVNVVDFLTQDDIPPGVAEEAAQQFIEAAQSEECFKSHERCGIRFMKLICAVWLHDSFPSKVGKLAEYHMELMANRNCDSLFTRDWNMSPLASSTTRKICVSTGYVLLSCLGHTDLQACACVLHKRYLSCHSEQSLGNLYGTQLVKHYCVVNNGDKYVEKDGKTSCEITLSIKKQKNILIRVGLQDSKVSAKRILTKRVHHVIFKHYFQELECKYKDGQASIFANNKVVYECPHKSDDPSYAEEMAITMYLDREMKIAKQDAQVTADSDIVIPREKRIKSENGLPQEERGEFPLNPKNVWKHVKVIFRGEKGIVDKFDLSEENKVDFETNGWVPLDLIVAQLKEGGEPAASEEALAEFMSMHDVLGRLDFKEGKGRALYHHSSDSRVNLEESDKVYEKLEFDNTDEEVLEQYMKQHGLEDVLYHSVTNIERITAANKNQKVGIKCAPYCKVVLATRCTVDAMEDYWESETIYGKLDYHVYLDVRDLLREGWVLRKCKVHNRTDPIVLVRFEDNTHIQEVQSTKREVYLPTMRYWHRDDGEKAINIDPEMLKENHKKYVTKCEQGPSSAKAMERCELNMLVQLIDDDMRRYEAGETMPHYELSRVAWDGVREAIEAVTKEKQYEFTVKDLEDKNVMLFLKRQQWPSDLVPHLLEGTHSQYTNTSHVTDALRPNTVKFNRQEFVGDAALDLCVACDCHTIDKHDNPLEWTTHITYFTTTVTNGHGDEYKDAGLLPIAKKLFENRSSLVLGVTPLAERNEKVHGDLLESLLGGMYLDMGLATLHERVRYLFAKYGRQDTRLGNLYKMKTLPEDCPVFTFSGKLFEESQLASYNEQKAKQGTKAKVTKMGAKDTGAVSILHGLKTIDLKKNKPAWTTHFRFQGMQSSYSRCFTSTEVHTRMTEALTRSVVGYTNEAVSLMSRLAIDLDGISSEEIVFPHHPKYGTWTIAEIIHRLVADKIPNHYNMTILLDISRPDKASQHMHWPFIPMWAADIYSLLCDLQKEFCTIEEDYVSLHEGPKYKLSVLENMRCEGCAQKEPKTAEYYEPNIRIFKCEECIKLKSYAKKAFKAIKECQLEEAFKAHLEKKWADYIDAGMFVSRKLRMYLSDKFDEDVDPPRPKGYPVHQKKIYLHTKPGSPDVKPELLYNFDDEKPVHHTNGVPVPHMDMLRLASLRHPTYMMSYHHKCTSGDGFWHPATLPENVEVQKEDTFEGPNIDALYSSAITLGDVKRITVSFADYEKKQNEWTEPYSVYAGDTFNKMFEVTIGSDRKELWQHGEMLLYVERHSRVEQKFKIEVVKMLEPEAAKQYCSYYTSEDTCDQAVQAVLDMWGESCGDRERARIVEEQPSPTRVDTKIVTGGVEQSGTKKKKKGKKVLDIFEPDNEAENLQESAGPSPASKREETILDTKIVTGGVEQSGTKKKKKGKKVLDFFEPDNTAENLQKSAGLSPSKREETIPEAAESVHTTVTMAAEPNVSATEALPSAAVNASNSKLREVTRSQLRSMDYVFDSPTEPLAPPTPLSSTAAPAAPFPYVNALATPSPNTLAPSTVAPTTPATQSPDTLAPSTVAPTQPLTSALVRMQTTATPPTSAVSDTLTRTAIPTSVPTMSQTTAAVAPSSTSTSSVVPQHVPPVSNGQTLPVQAARSPVPDLLSNTASMDPSVPLSAGSASNLTPMATTAQSSAGGLTRETLPVATAQYQVTDVEHTPVMRKIKKVRAPPDVHPQLNPPHVNVRATGTSPQTQVDASHFPSIAHQVNPHLGNWQSVEHGQPTIDSQVSDTRAAIELLMKRDKQWEDIVKQLTHRVELLEQHIPTVYPQSYTHYQEAIPLNQSQNYTQQEVYPAEYTPQHQDPTSPSVPQHVSPVSGQPLPVDQPQSYTQQGVYPQSYTHYQEAIPLNQSQNYTQQEVYPAEYTPQHQDPTSPSVPQHMSPVSGQPLPVDQPQSYTQQGVYPVGYMPQYQPGFSQPPEVSQPAQNHGLQPNTECGYPPFQNTNYLVEGPG